MTTIFIILSTSLTLFMFNLTDFSAEVGRDLQTICHSLLPSTEFKDAYSAMVCGVDLPAGNLKSDLQRTGLLHIFVVSGAHLIFLLQLLNFLKLRTALLLTPILIIYAALTGLNPPVVRSLFALGVRWLNGRKKLFWRPVDETLFTGAFCLLIFPFWWNSLSFLLSWLASVGLSLGRNQLQQSLWIYILLIFPLAGLGLTDPFSIFLNWIVAPILGVALFPLCLLAVICPPLTLFVDWVWHFFFFILRPLADWMPAPAIFSFSPIYLCWVGIFLLHGSLSEWSAWRRRKVMSL